MPAAGPTLALRAAIAPFLAHDALTRAGYSYKWMLYGDDDTVWNIQASQCYGVGMSCCMLPPYMGVWVETGEQG